MSLSSTIVTGITAFRNPNGSEQEWVAAHPREAPIPLKVAIAEVGYIITIPFAAVETALSLIAKILSHCLPIGQEGHNRMTKQLESSAFSVVWAIVDACLNPFCNDLIQTERVARACAASGDLFRVPAEAL